MCENNFSFILISQRKSKIILTILSLDQEFKQIFLPKNYLSKKNSCQVNIEKFIKLWVKFLINIKDASDSESRVLSIKL